MQKVFGDLRFLRHDNHPLHGSPLPSGRKPRMSYLPFNKAAKSKSSSAGMSSCTPSTVVYRICGAEDGVLGLLPSPGPSKQLSPMAVDVLPYSVNRSSIQFFQRPDSEVNGQTFSTSTSCDRTPSNIPKLKQTMCQSVHPSSSWHWLSASASADPRHPPPPQ